MECATAKDKIVETLDKVSALSREQKNTKAMQQFAVDSFLDKILVFTEKVNSQADKVFFVTEKMQELTWITDMDEECLKQLDNLLKLCKVYHKKLLQHYVNLSWAIRKGIAKEAMKKYKSAIDELKEYTEDLHDIFFGLRNDDEFNDITKKLENL